MLLWWCHCSHFVYFKCDTLTVAILFRSFVRITHKIKSFVQYLVSTISKIGSYLSAENVDHVYGLLLLWFFNHGQRSQVWSAAKMQQHFCNLNFCCYEDKTEYILCTSVFSFLYSLPKILRHSIHVSLSTCPILNCQISFLCFCAFPLSSIPSPDKRKNKQTKNQAPLF